MENKNQGEKKKPAGNIADILAKVGRFSARWFYLLVLFAVAVYAVFVWNKYIVKSEWSEEKKQSYINEQAVFSFDRESYEQATDFLKRREQKTNNGERFSGKDIFFPE
jgi:hypothetical protein